MTPDLWLVLQWPTDLLTSAEREALEDHLEFQFGITVVRYEVGDPSSAVQILGSAQQVPHPEVLGFLQKFVSHPTTEMAPNYDPNDDDAADDEH